MNRARERKAKRRTDLWAAAALVLGGTGWTLWQASGVGAQPAIRPLLGSEQQDPGITLAFPPLTRKQGVGIKGDLFDNPLVVPVQKVKPAAPAQPVVQPAPPVETPPPPDPLADYVYMGVSSLNGERFALLEHRKTHEGIYLKMGDAFNGYTAGRIDAKELTLDSPAGARTLALNDNYDLIPLDRDAEYLGGRVTAHNSTDKAEQDKQEVASLTKSYANHLLSARTGLQWINNAADMEHMKNQVFDGKMSQEEFDRRTRGTVDGTVKLYFQVLSDDVSLTDTTEGFYRPNVW